jgi:hypothetical protein
MHQLSKWEKVYRTYSLQLRQNWVSWYDLYFHCNLDRTRCHGTQCIRCNLDRPGCHGTQVFVATFTDPCVATWTEHRVTTPCVFVAT